MPSLPRSPRMLSGIFLVTLLVVGCSKERPRSQPPCPRGTWVITGDEIRTLLGAEIGPDAKATSVSGRVIREMRDSGATVFEFDDVQLTGTSTGGPKVVGATGSLMAQTTTTGDTLDATLTNNRIAVSLDGLPAGIDFTLFATKNLERTLTGPATFSCDGSTLRTIDADSTIRLTWSRARAR